MLVELRGLCVGDELPAVLEAIEPGADVGRPQDEARQRGRRDRPSTAAAAGGHGDGEEHEREDAAHGPMVWPPATAQNPYRCSCQ